MFSPDIPTPEGTTGWTAAENNQLRERLAAAKRSLQQATASHTALTTFTDILAGPGPSSYAQQDPYTLRITTTQPLFSSTPLTTQPTVSMTESQRVRRSEPPIFKGDAKDAMVRQKEYTNWRSLGDTYSRVREKVDKVAAKLLNTGVWSHSWRDVSDMLLFLDQVYITVDVLAQAHRDFQALEQGSTAFADFISSFIRLADQSRQPPALRVIALQQKVNGALQKALVPQVQRLNPEDDKAWIQLFRDLFNNIANRAFRKLANFVNAAYTPLNGPDIILGLLWFIALTDALREVAATQTQGFSADEAASLAPTAVLRSILIQDDTVDPATIPPRLRAFHD
ncbi:hypothetical protein DL765_003260 [Monosporascus sp. GIB2]|nr:hypothetical protein DL765_003260 [Monosporascus sp. GIB2]